jgi:hypothetical protein
MSVVKCSYAHHYGICGKDESVVTRLRNGYVFPSRSEDISSSFLQQWLFLSGKSVRDVKLTITCT